MITGQDIADDKYHTHTHSTHTHTHTHTHDKTRHSLFVLFFRTSIYKLKSQSTGMAEVAKKLIESGTP